MPSIYHSKAAQPSWTTSGFPEHRTPRRGRRPHPTNPTPTLLPATLTTHPRRSRKHGRNPPRTLSPFQHPIPLSETISPQPRRLPRPTYRSQPPHTLPTQSGNPWMIQVRTPTPGTTQMLPTTPRMRRRLLLRRGCHDNTLPNGHNRQQAPTFTPRR